MSERVLGELRKNGYLLIEPPMRRLDSEKDLNLLYRCDDGKFVGLDEG